MEFARTLLAEGCLSTERWFLVECDRAGEKGFFSERALQDSCKHTLREAPFTVMLIWSARDSPQTPGFLLALVLCAVGFSSPVPVFPSLVLWVNLLCAVFLKGRLTETGIRLSVNLQSPCSVYLSDTSDIYYYPDWQL